jgi:hypothetical protein
VSKGKEEERVYGSSECFDFQGDAIDIYSYWRASI